MIGLALLFGPATSRAIELQGIPGTFQIHGFLSQAYVLTTGNDFFGQSETRDGGSFDFREIGINASWRTSPWFQVSAQGLSRWAGDGDNGQPRLDHGFLDLSPVTTKSDLWGIRVGRVPTPFGLYNETRDVPITRPSILLPQSIYFDRVRDVLLSADSAHVYGERRTDFGDFFVQAGAGWLRLRGDENEIALLGMAAPGHLESDISYLGRLMYEKEGGRLRLAFSLAEANVDYERGAQDLIPDGSIRFRPYILSAQYNAERLSLTGEYALRQFQSSGFGQSTTRVTGESYYLQAAYRFAQGWEAMARYDVLYSDRSDRDGKDFEAQTRGTVPAHTRFAKDLTVGLRWDITPHWMARVEYHLVDGTAWLPRLDNRDTADLERYWNLFSALVSFHF
ncbi:MAG: hypothetical protein AB1578_03820 [Thermodesulfobacteriota bacterium]